MTVNKASFKVAGAVIAALSTTAAVAGDCPGSHVDKKGFREQCTTNPATLKPLEHAIFWQGQVWAKCGVKTEAGPVVPGRSITLPDGKHYVCNAPGGWQNKAMGVHND